MTSSLIIRRKPGDHTKGFVIAHNMAFPCALGKSGMTATKREGDGATPILTTKPLYGFYRADRETKPKTHLDFIPVRRNWGWCDDVDHQSYNRRITKPFGASHEDMWRDDALYDLAVVLDINISQCVRGSGSALFMHVARENFAPTEGCIALKKRELRRLLTIMGRNTQIVIRS